MAFNYDALESRLNGVLHDALNEARANEPAIEQAAADALTVLGAPSVVTDGLKALLGGLLGHFQAKQQEQQAADQAAADAAAQAQQEQPSS